MTEGRKGAEAPDKQISSENKDGRYQTLAYETKPSEKRIKKAGDGSSILQRSGLMNEGQVENWRNSLALWG
ncbi:hypothetical protein BaRGS_00010751 [Batillaria attramentaria]|uniref:Uncharacterized protein n=1 Tax=Batillaria attramentaria TaxID=370345 RepID=A0ABD0LET0_9CAEN